MKIMFLQCLNPAPSSQVPAGQRCSAQALCTLLRQPPLFQPGLQLAVLQLQLQQEGDLLQRVLQQPAETAPRRNKVTLKDLEMLMQLNPKVPPQTEYIMRTGNQHHKKTVRRFPDSLGMRRQVKCTSYKSNRKLQVVYVSAAQFILTYNMVG